MATPPIIVLVLVGGIYLSDPSKTAEILGILLGTFLGFFSASVLQKRTSKEEIKKRRCSEIFAPLYNETGEIVEKLKYSSPEKIENSLFKQVKYKPLYIASSDEFKKRIENFIELIDEYNSLISNAINWIRFIIEEKIINAYGDNSLDSREIKEYDPIYVVEDLRNEHTKHFLYMVLEYDDLSKLRDRDKHILIPKLHMYISGRLKLLRPQMESEKRAKLARSLTLKTNYEILEELFVDEGLIYLKMKKDELYEYAKETKEYLYGKIQEFPID